MKGSVGEIAFSILTEVDFTFIEGIVSKFEAPLNSSICGKGNRYK